MPDLPISGLPEMVPGVLQNTDELAIADNSASETKRIQVEELLTTGLNALPPQSIDGGMLELPLPPDSVDTNAIQDGAVTDDKVADGIDGRQDCRWHDYRRRAC